MKLSLHSARRRRPVEAIPRTACAASCVFTINPSSLLSNLPVLFTTWLPSIRMEDCPPHHHHIPPSLSLSLSLSLSVTCRAGTLKRRVVQKPSISRHNVTRSERESDGGRTREEDTICSTGCGDQSETEEEEYSCHEPEVSRLLFHHESDEHCAVEFLVGVDWTRHRRGTMRVDSRERGRRRRK